MTGPEQQFEARKHYVSEHLEVKKVGELTPEQRETFFGWIEGLSPGDTLGFGPDNEEGPDFAEWIRDHEQTDGDTTYVAFDKRSKSIVATASVIKRDRTIEADPDGWMIGGVQVMGCYRKKGIGTAFMELLDLQFQKEAYQSGRDIPVKLFSNYNPAIKIYKALGFEVIQDAEQVSTYIDSEEFETQYKKIYRPWGDLSLPAIS